MITEKQKTLSEQSVYGDLKGKAISGLIYPIKCSYDDVVMVYESSLVLQDEIKPILRPLSDLTKEITHKGYNDDKPFIPIVDIFEHLSCLYVSKESKIEIFYDRDEDGLDNDNYPYCVMIFDDTKLEISSSFTPALFTYNSEAFQWEYCFTSVSHEYFDKLLRWHFDSRKLLEKSEAISTDEVNPYEVK